MYERPSDPIDYLVQCLSKVKAAAIKEKATRYPTDMFLPLRKKRTSKSDLMSLPPVAMFKSPERAPRGTAGEAVALGSGSARVLPSIRANKSPEPAASAAAATIVRTPQLALSVKQGIPSTPKVAPSSKIIFVLGGPGSGKGTQCARIVERHGCAHLSAGDLLRAEVESGSARGNEMSQLMSEGKLVPQEWVIELLRQAIVRADQGKGVLVDGFPRAVDQAELFESTVSKCQFMLWFDCDQPTMEKRLLKRGETSGRSDDNAEAIKKRFDTYLRQSLPVLKFFEATGRARVINAMQDTDAVFADVIKVADAELGGTSSSDQ